MCQNFRKTNWLGQKRGSRTVWNDQPLLKPIADDPFAHFVSNENKSTRCVKDMFYTQERH